MWIYSSYRVFESLTRMDILTAKLILHAKDFNMYIIYSYSTVWIMKKLNVILMFCFPFQVAKTLMTYIIIIIYVYTWPISIDWYTWHMLLNLLQ